MYVVPILDVGVILPIDPTTSDTKISYSPLRILKHHISPLWILNILQLMMHEHMTHQTHTFIQDITITNFTISYTYIHHHFIHMYIHMMMNLFFWSGSLVARIHLISWISGVSGVRSPTPVYNNALSYELSYAHGTMMNLLSSLIHLHQNHYHHNRHQAFITLRNNIHLA